MSNSMKGEKFTSDKAISLGNVRVYVYSYKYCKNNNGIYYDRSHDPTLIAVNDKNEFLWMFRPQPYQDNTVWIEMVSVSEDKNYFIVEDSSVYRYLIEPKTGVVVDMIFRYKY